jgi:hypothetical protein
MALFKTTEDLKGYLPARATFKIEDLLPKLKEVEQEFLAEQILGQDLYDALVGQYEDSPGVAMDDIFTELLEKCRPAVANLAFHRGSAILNLKISAAGFVVEKTDTLAPASEFRTKELVRSFLVSGYRGLDVLINWLLENAGELDEWTDSAPYQAITSGILRHTSHFDQFVHIGNSGWLFRKMLPTIRRIEEEAITTHLCSTTLKTEILQAITDGTDAHASLVKLCRQATSHLAMADAIVELSLAVDDQGVWTFASLMGGQTSGGPTPASDLRLDHQAKHHRRIGTGYLKLLKDELQRLAEADNTHPYYDSDCFTDPDAEKPSTIHVDTNVGGFFT